MAGRKKAAAIAPSTLRETTVSSPETEAFCGAAGGNRTHDIQNHNLALYRLSYSRRNNPFILPKMPG